ncbi:MAG: methionine--tRNA ligase [Patescibacteria group bacterium]
MEKKFYITTSIAYVNAPPHIGFALESAQTDVLARYFRKKGKDVFFLTGADEHGVKIARAAEAVNKTPEELVDENSEKFKNLKSALNLSWDGFIRTSDKKIHWPVAQELWKRLENNGDIYKKIYKGFYCVGHEAFVTKKDLVDGKCVDHQKEPEVIEEENWFFRLSKYTKEIESRIKNNELRIVPETRKNEILSLLNEGLEDISFSRPRKDLSWGIPVPGDDSQTMYVWADALSNYISGRGGIKEWKKYPADIHVIGKDILRFHAAIWLAMLLSAKLPFPKAIYVHGHILSGGQKMSKSLGNVIDPFELVKKYGVDAVRYFLLREISSTGDGDFSYEKFEERYNGDLANGLGNLVARVAAIGEKLGDIKLKNSFFDRLFSSGRKKDLYEKLFNDFKLDKILEKIWEEIHDLDKLINSEKPWSEKEEAVLRRKIADYGKKIINIADTLSPFMPETSKKIKEHFNLSGGILKIKKGVNLFPRLDKMV